MELSLIDYSNGKRAKRAEELTENLFESRKDEKLQRSFD
jgi:hypothetical protein